MCWDLNPPKTQFGTQTQVVGTQFSSVQFSRSVVSDSLRPHGLQHARPPWDSDPAKTQGTWFQDLMKLGFLMSNCRKNSVRDKVIGKKWTYSDTEGRALHRQSVGPRRGRVQPVVFTSLIPTSPLSPSGIPI